MEYIHIMTFQKLCAEGLHLVLHLPSVFEDG